MNSILLHATALLLAIKLMGMSEKTGTRLQISDRDTTFAQAFNLNVGYDGNETKSPIRFRVWRILPPSRNGVRMAYASLASDDFKKEKLGDLAAALNKKYTKYNKLKVLLFDDPDLAKGYAYGHIHADGIETEARGLYVLDRTTGEEYLQFSSRKGKPLSETKIELSRKRTGEINK